MSRIMAERRREKRDGRTRVRALAGVFIAASLIASPATADHDLDEDRIPDWADNCVEQPNVIGRSDLRWTQVDTDLDGFGNACDADFDQNGRVNSFDWYTWLLCFVTTDRAPPADPTCMESDLSGNRRVNALDFALLVPQLAKAAAGEPPLGPSALACANATSELGACCPSRGMNTCLSQNLNLRQFPDCHFVPSLPDDPTFPDFCDGQTILVDANSRNRHRVEPRGGNLETRFWPFAQVLFADGFVVNDVPKAPLFPDIGDTLDVLARDDVLVLATPAVSVFGGVPPIDVVEAAELAAWVEGGGRLLLTWDHDPFDGVDHVLAAFGLEPAGSTPIGTSSFVPLPSAGQGELLSGNAIAEGRAAADALAEVATIHGLLFRDAPGWENDPARGPLVPVLRWNGEVHAGYFLYGAGRVFVSGETGALTEQTDPQGNISGLSSGADNERYLRNVVRWLAALDE